jgi:hypothetical protein
MKELATITPQPIVQMCWAVDDMEASAQQWVETMGRDRSSWSSIFNSTSRPIAAN